MQISNQTTSNSTNQTLSQNISVSQRYPDDKNGTVEVPRSDGLPVQTLASGNKTNVTTEELRRKVLQVSNATNNLKISTTGSLV